MSGVFAVTFSVIFAYVADITQEHERSTAYGLVRRWLTKQSPVKLCVFKHLPSYYLICGAIYHGRIVPVFVNHFLKLTVLSQGVQLIKKTA